MRLSATLRILPLWSLCALAAAQGVPGDPSAEDVVWTTPSDGPGGAMPIGNGEVGAMVWFTADGTLHVLVSRTDSFSEASRLLKPGLVRVRFPAVPEGGPFEQRLHLGAGRIAIAYGAEPARTEVELFVDAASERIFVAWQAPRAVVAECDSWRRQARRLVGEELQSSWTMKGAPDDVVVTESADELRLLRDPARGGWRHHNASSVVGFSAARQGLPAAAVADPLLRRTFGLLVGGAGATFGHMPSPGPAILVFERAQSLCIAAPCRVVEHDADEWDRAASELCAAADIDAARARTAEWWAAFWRRSWVRAALGEPARAAAGATTTVTQAWTLQRWVQACGGRGAFPIKFNGSIFTVAPGCTGDQPFDHDWRRWGDCFWWQNTRLPYYPMLAQGDLDMQRPLFALYRRTLPVAMARVAAWHAPAQGAYWPETMTPFGTHANGDYGWQRDGVPASKVLCPWWEYARNQGLELLALMLDRFDYERDPVFVRDELLPLAVPTLQWFATAYPRGDDGVLRIEPTQSLETWWTGVRDDLPTVAGLHWVLDRLLALTEDLVPGPQRAAWRSLRTALPPVPVREQDGVRMLAAAARHDDKRSNCESPELYAVFPFRLYGLGKPDLDLARAAYTHRHDRFTNGWPQDGQDAALLGFAGDAVANVLAKVNAHHPRHRFPAMWGPNFDWLPDQCHGSNLLDTVARMLLQCDDGVIRVLPCWPLDRDVRFRLHAPQRTVVECELRGGRIERLEVTPAERREDVRLPEGLAK